MGKKYKYLPGPPLHLLGLEQLLDSGHELFSSVQQSTCKTRGTENPATAEYQQESHQGYDELIVRKKKNNANRSLIPLIFYPGSITKHPEFDGSAT